MYNLIVEGNEGNNNASRSILGHFDSDGDGLNDGDIGAGEIYIEVSKDGIHWRRIFGVIEINDGETVDIGQYIAWKGSSKLYLRIFDDDVGRMEELISGEFDLSSDSNGWKDYWGFRMDGLQPEMSHIEIEFTEKNNTYKPSNQGDEVNYLI